MVLTADVARLLVRELDTFQREVGLFPDDESLWKVAPGVTNSAGTLALHIAGNLQHFIGAVLGRSGYVRNREREFQARGLTRAQVVGELQAAIDAVSKTFASVDPAALSQLYPSPPGGITTRTDLFLLHLLSHAAFHLGQAGYIRRIATGDPTSADPMGMAVLNETTI